MIGLHCDGPECGSWSPTDRAGLFVIVTRGDNTLVGHFCCLWCMTRWGAEHSTPTETVEPQ